MLPSMTAAECAAKKLGLSACAAQLVCPHDAGQFTDVVIEATGVRCVLRDPPSTEKVAAELHEALANANPPTSPWLYVLGAAGVAAAAWWVLR